MRSIVALTTRCVLRIIPIVELGLARHFRDFGDILSVYKRAVAAAESYVTEGGEREGDDLRHLLTQENMVTILSLMPRIEGAGDERLTAACGSIGHMFATAIDGVHGDWANAAIHATDAFIQAADAADGVPRKLHDQSLERAFQHDIAVLSRKRIGDQPGPGPSFNPRQSGPLGPLWPNGTPSWYADPIGAFGSAAVPFGPITASGYGIVTPPTPEQSEVLGLILESQPEPLIAAYFDDSGFSHEDIELCLSYLSEVYREQGGVGLKVVGGRTMIPQGAEVAR